jgi:NADH-quinone oxidoreductase subunit A
VADYLPILTMLILAILFVAGSLGISQVFRPSRPTPAKSAPYECGIVPTREPAERFPVRFYLVAMIFIIFDIEIIFLYPWAVIFQRDLHLFGLMEMLVFAIFVFVSFVYLVSRGALDWGPAKRLRPLITVTSDRTTDTTVRRVGPEDEAA